MSFSIASTKADSVSLSSYKAPSQNSGYPALPLPLKTSIRLLRLIPREDDTVRCQLEVVDLASKPDYRALSYTWGPPSNEARERGMTSERSCSIICNEEELFVTENLLDFLRIASKRPEEYGGYFWIDAICINQDDKSEKTSEVLKMADIYRSAESVLVWLGESDEFTEQAIELLSVLTKLPTEELNNLDAVGIVLADVVAAKFGPSITSGHWEALAKFFNRTWYSRIWILQEVIMANHINVLCGAEKLDWQSIVKASGFISGPSMTNYFASTTPGKSFKVNNGATPWWLAAVRNSLKMGLTWRLESALQQARGYSASEKHDMVYAMLSLSDEPFLDPEFGTSALLPDYSRDPAETYAVVARLILKHSNNLHLLSLVEDYSESTVHGMPSWAPDWSVTHVKMGFPGAIYSSAADKSQKHQLAETLDLLLVHGISLDTVTAVGPPSDKVFDNWMALKEWLEILQCLDPVYITGQPRIEAFWRTSIRDIDMKAYDHPAPRSMESSFQHWILFALLHDDSVNRGVELAYLDRLAETNSFTLPTTESIATWSQLLYNRTIDDALRKILYYDSSFNSVNSLRLFRTPNGFLGLGPRSTQPRDEVWILPGSEVPLILRKTSKDRRYRIVGGAYVHGFMHGEVFNGVEPELTDIEIE